MAQEAHQANVSNLNAKTEQEHAGAQLKQVQAAALARGEPQQPPDPNAAVTAHAKAMADQAKAQEAIANAVYTRIMAAKEAATPIVYPQPSSGSN